MLAASRVPDSLRPFERQTIHNALLESFTVHARVLLHFLYGSKSQSDDVLAEDFFDTPSVWQQRRPGKSPLLDTVSKRVGKEVAHLTYKRLEVTPETKPWSYLGIVKEIGLVLMEFSKTVPVSRLKDAVVSTFRELGIPDLNADQSAGDGKASL